MVVHKGKPQVGCGLALQQLLRSWCAPRPPLRYMPHRPMHTHTKARRAIQRNIISSTGLSVCPPSPGAQGAAARSALEQVEGSAAPIAGHGTDHLSHTPTRVYLLTCCTKRPAMRRSDGESLRGAREVHGGAGAERPVPRGHRCG